MLPFVGPVPAHIIGWLVALLLGGGTAAWLMARAGMSDRVILWSLLPRIAAIFVGSKLLYLVEDWQRWWGDPSAFLSALFSEQMRIPGGLLLMVIVGAVVSRAIRVSPLLLTDTIAPAAGLVIFGIRIGCFLEGCCYGYPTSLPWGVAFPSRSDGRPAWTGAAGPRQMTWLTYTDPSGKIATSDAPRILRKAVGQAVTLECPVG